MKTLILKNIVSSNTVYQLNQYIKKNKNSLGKVKVLFLAQTESNRNWKLDEKPTFDYQVLKSTAVELKGKDLFTYFINHKFLNELRKINPDRIIISGWDLLSYQLSFFWGKLNKKHVTLWSGSTKNEKSWRRSLTLSLVRLFVYLSTDFIAYGSRAKEYLVNLGADPKKIKIFPNDVNQHRFPKKKSSRKNLIFVGQLIERKGILDLFAVYKSFKRKHPGWGMVIVGTGQLESKIKQIIKKEKLQDVKLLGFVEQYDLPKIYATSSVLVLPSRQEVWGLVVNEALHSGLKVVVGDKCGCVDDLVKQGQNGYTFKSGNLQSLAETLNQAVEQKPFFSIITSTKNMDKFILKNLISVQKQTFKDIEHIFIDGFSKDNTIKIIKKYKRQSDYPVTIQKTKPQGISNAMNQGIKKAKGRYLIHLHADDYLFDINVLQDTYDYLLSNPRLDWIYGQIQTIEKNAKPIGIYPRHKLLQIASPTLLKYTNFIPHQAVFIKKEVFKKFGLFNEKLSSKMDLDYWLKIKNKTTWQFYPKVISNFTIHSSAQSSSKKFLTENLKNLDQVLRASLSKPEYLLANQLYKIQLKINKVIR